MEPIKIDVAVSVNVDLSQGTQDFLLNILDRKIQAENERAAKSYEPLKELISKIFAQSPCGTLGPLPTEVVAATEEAKEQPEPSKEEPKATKVQPEPSKEEPKAAPTIGIEDVRSMLTKKVNDHREAIRAKLNELDAKSVTTLDPAKYGEMYEFLKSL